jgi:hypothetical protein
VYGNLLMHFAKVPILHKSSVKLAQTAVVRAWVGLSNVGFATMAGADDPAAQDFAAFRYSTAAGDTTWKCCTKDERPQRPGLPRHPLHLRAARRHRRRLAPAVIQRPTPPMARVPKMRSP